MIVDLPVSFAPTGAAGVVYCEQNSTPRLRWILINVRRNEIKTKCAGISLIYASEIISWWKF